MAQPSEIILGIDLGTTFSLVAVADERGPRVLRDAAGEARVPSVLTLAPAAGGPPRIVVGWEARNHAVENARTTVYSIKRLIGKSSAEVLRELPFLAYAVVPGPHDTVRVDIGGTLYSPEEISAAILRTLRERAEQRLGVPVSKAVITVPAYFDDAQRQATRQAGQAAGLEVVRMVNEPTAAALAYGIGLRELARSGPAATDAGEAPPRGERPGRVALLLPKCESAAGAVGAATAAGKADQTVAVYDLGGGTFDVSILRIERGVFQVLATAGDTHLGGDDFDRAIIQIVAAEIQARYGLQVQAPAAKQALRGMAEAVKIRLSEHATAELELDLGEERIYRRTISRAELEAASTPLVERTLALCSSALRDARLTPADLDEVVLVGGATRMPLVRRLVAAHFGRPPYTALNPDEVVALGAALQGSLLAGSSLDMLLLDVTPLSLGIETMGGAMGKLILRNTTIPARATEMFTTFIDGQTAIKLRVLQGERELAADCRTLGEFELRDIPAMPAGLPKIEVEFLIDANGILNVSARELRSGRAESIQVVPVHGLTRAETERMLRESALHAREDMDAHRRIDLCNQVEFDTVKTAQVLARVGGLLDAAERERIETEADALRTLAGRARAAPETVALDDLHQALQNFGRSTQHLAEIGIREALRG